MRQLERASGKLLRPRPGRTRRGLRPLRARGRVTLSSWAPMKHATDASLDSLATILAAIRELPGLRERKRGAFYRKSSGFLHFHEDPLGMFADLKTGADFVRFPVNCPKEIAVFLREARKAARS